jgi:glycosyltransferase involved in cell wall biosynthesis
MGVDGTDSRPTVLVVTHNYPRHPEDQAGQFIQTLIQPIRDRFRFVVVAPHATGLALREDIAGIDVVRFRYGADDEETLAYEGNMHEQVLSSWGSRLLLLRFLRSMRACVADLIVSEQPKAAHIHWWVPGALSAAGVLYRRQVPYILTTHGSDVTLLDKFKFLRPVAKRLFRRAAACTAVSTYLRERLQDIAGVDALVLPMPFDDTKFHLVSPPDLSPPVITCIGRFIERKGIRYLLEACALLRDTGVAFRLKLVGDGPLRSDLEERTQSLSLADRVEWTGNIPHRNIPEIIRQSSVVVMPSIRDWKGEVEGLGMVLAEASAMGRPVVGTDLAGPKDAIDHEQSGLLVPPADPKALAGALNRILSDPDLAHRFGQSGMVYAAKHFSPASQSDRLAHTLSGIMF